MEYVLNEKIINLLNYRIEQEEYSSRIYLSMSKCLEYYGYENAAKLWKKYSEEELEHANWAYNYLLDLDIKPIIPALKEPPQEFGEEYFKNIIVQSYEHEVDITNQCQELAKTALEVGDFMTLSLAQKYLDEQKEELAKAQLHIDKFLEFYENKISLHLFDEFLKNYL